MRVKKSNSSHATANFDLPGVGKQIAKHLARLNIFSVQDLLLHLPYRYQDRTCIQSIRELAPGKEAVIEGKITQVMTPMRGRAKLVCELSDA
ncbi:MAG: hypothetical protein JO149_03350, partial [Gammaproteobacteria bacterium]|nr:hypothetical protein [Gammaproteobacteria bacterium]